MWFHNVEIYCILRISDTVIHIITIMYSCYTVYTSVVCRSDSSMFYACGDSNTLVCLYTLDIGLQIYIINYVSNWTTIPLSPTETIYPRLSPSVDICSR